VAITKRASGILLHITSLPNPYCIGDIGPSAYKFADFLADANQRYWQVLPINPINLGAGNSPYSGISAFAGNSLFISLDLLKNDGLLKKSDLAKIPSSIEVACDYSRAAEDKNNLFDRAYEYFLKNKKSFIDYNKFCETQEYWLNDYTVFAALRNKFSGRLWNKWDRPYRDRDPQALKEFASKHSEEIERERFLQYVFFKQWKKLKAYCNKKGIMLIGDVPIYVSLDSVDVWTNVNIFKLDEEKRPTHIAGVPPDYFSETGQLWGNPVYRWDELKKTGFEWWVRRMEHNLELFDSIRIDHFRGLVAYWEILASEKTAINGKWVRVPADEFFLTLKERFGDISIIAEDLGIITEDVKVELKRLGFPGMKVLLFAFNEDNPKHPYLPHNYDPNCVVYTGTHDNNTVRGWFSTEASGKDKRRLSTYLGKNVTEDNVHWELIKLAMKSVANTVVIPMQDVLGLGSEARMNKPSRPHNNWHWRLRSKDLTRALSTKLTKITKTHSRR